MDANDLLTIGEVASRAGVATSALRFYEERGLISSERTESNHRRYRRSVLRIVAVIQAAQKLGLSLAEIQDALAELPEGRTPTGKHWTRMSSRWKDRLDQDIAMLEKLRDDLDGCIGCGCLSLERCALFNADDVAGSKGPGPRYLFNAAAGGTA